jgi:SNF2 family DNA or RNA helicase
MWIAVTLARHCGREQPRTHQTQSLHIKDDAMAIIQLICYEPICTVCDLEGKRRWVVTGTPVQNKPEEMLAYFRFVGISPFDDARIFRRTFMENPAKGTLRLQAMSNALILRRTKASVFGGVGQEGSTTMPRRTVKVVEVQLSDDELALSKGFESLSRQVR